MDVSQLWDAMNIGLGVWVFTYGINRVYLWAKGMVS